MRRALLAIAVLLLLGGGMLYRALRVPDLGAYQHLFASPAAKPSPGSVTATFLGVSTLLFSDGETSLMTDGFFSRPGLMTVMLGQIEPDRAAIASTLAKAKVDRLAAVVVVHSHYDHSMDAPEVARRTGAVVVGSESTANVARGWDLPETQIRVPRAGEALRFGKFTVRLFDSVHAPLPSFMSPDADGVSVIRAPLRPPAAAFDYKLGTAYTVLIEHPLGNSLVQGSAGIVEGALAGVRADVVFLGTGGLGMQAPAYQEKYFHEHVEITGAKRLIPIHWDNFTRPLTEPLRPNFTMGSGFAGEMEFLTKRSAKSGVQLNLLHAFQTTVLFPAQ